MSGTVAGGGGESGGGEAAAAARREASSSVLWAFQALVAACAFCAVTVLSYGDWELLSAGRYLGGGATGPGTAQVDVPVVGLKVVFLAFFAVAPAVLLSIQGYLQIQLAALTEDDPAGWSASGLVRQHARSWPLSLLGLALHLLPPATIALLAWKVWPRREGGGEGAWELPLLGASWGPTSWGLTPWQWVPLVLLGASLVASAAGLVSQWVSLTAPDRPAEGRPGAWRLGTGLALLALIPLAFGVAAAARTLDLRGAPMERADLRRFDLRGADLRDARLVGARLGGARMDKADLTGALLDDADLRGARLPFALLNHARLNGADLRGSCLIGAQMSGAEIEGADLRGSWAPALWLRPVPRTPRDRTAEREPKDRPDTLGGGRFEGAVLCGAHLDAAPWVDPDPPGLGAALAVDGFPALTPYAPPSPPSAVAGVVTTADPAPVPPSPALPSARAATTAERVPVAALGAVPYEARLLGDGPAAVRDRDAYRAGVARRCVARLNEDAAREGAFRSACGSWVGVPLTSLEPADNRAP